MRYASSKSFEFLEPDQIDEANVVEHLSLGSKNFQTINTGGETWDCAWAPDNSYFAWSSGYRIVHLIPWNNALQKRHDPTDFDGLNGRKYHVIDCCETVWSLAFGSGLSEKEQKCSKCYLRNRIDTPLVIATGHTSGKIKLWDCKSGSLIIELLDHRATVRCLDFTKDGSYQLLSASQDNTIKFWDLNNDGNMYYTYKLPGIKFFGCCFSPDGKWIVAVGGKRTVLQWRMPHFEETPVRLSGHHNDVVACCFSPDSALIATAAFDTKIILWGTDTHQQIKVLGHLHPSPSLIFAGGANDHYVRSVAFSPNATVVGSVCDDGFVRFWNLSDDSDPVSISSIGDVISCSFSTGGGVLATGCRDGDVYFLSTPIRVASLKNLCRGTIRKHISTKDAVDLPLPSRVIKYLQYYDYINV